MRAGPTGAECQSDIESAATRHYKIPLKSVRAVVVREADKSNKWVLVLGIPRGGLRKSVENNSRVGVVAGVFIERRVRTRAFVINAPTSSKRESTSGTGSSGGAAGTEAGISERRRSRDRLNM